MNKVPVLLPAGCSSQEVAEVAEVAGCTGQIQEYKGSADQEEWMEGHKHPNHRLLMEVAVYSMPATRPSAHRMELIPTEYQRDMLQR